MKKERLIEVLSIPSVFGREELVRNYIVKYAIDNNIEYKIDKKGNVYLTKGKIHMTEGEFYPCVVAHMDTVHKSQESLIDTNQRLTIVETKSDNPLDSKVVNILTARLPNSDNKAGIGGDDKCGVFVCIEMLENFEIMKAAFFVEEEIGMKGSREADSEFFTNVGYAIQFDAPSDNWITEVCSGVKLFDNEFKGLITETLSNNGYTSFSNDPFTDVNQLAQKFDFCCLNLGCGYHRQHTLDEYVIVEEVENSVKVGIEMITKLGLKFYEHKRKKSPIIESAENYYFDEDPYIKKMSVELTESIIDMLIEGVDKEEISEYVYLYLTDVIEDAN